MTDFFTPPPTSLPLRDYQAENVLELIDLIDRGESRIVDKLPTRAGKTRIAIEVIKRYRVLGKRATFVTPRISLIEQTCRAFDREGLRDYGVIQGRHYKTDPLAPIQIASAQTLARRIIPLSNIVFVDECHLRSQAVLAWMADPRWQKVPFIGLSATPWAKGMGKHWSKLVQPISILELTEKGYLTPFRVLAPPPPDLSGIKTVAGDYHEGQLAKRCDQPQITGKVVETWLKRARDRRTVVYGINRAHAQHLQERFREAGAACEYVDGDTPMFEREDMFRRLESGETQILSSVSTIDTGVDLPCISCVVDARPTKSRMRYVQSLGRGITPYPGKEHCLFLDHAGNVRRLGIITEIGSNVLDDGEEQRSAERQPEKSGFDARLCPECHCVQPPRSRECPQCGHVFYAITPVIETDVELVELGATGVGARFESDKFRWYAGLLWLRQDALRRGKAYSPKWPAVNFKEKFGHWPDRSWPEVPVEPTIEIRNWVRSKQIAFAKARRYG